MILYIYNISLKYIYFPLYNKTCIHESAIMKPCSIQCTAGDPIFYNIWQETFVQLVSHSILKYLIIKLEDGCSNR